MKKYALYAIGEILLVVIGILIALQINNWNEERKSLKTSREILGEIKRNVEFNTVRFQEEIEIEYKVISAIDLVLENITQTKVYDDSLNKQFHLCIYWPGSAWKTSGYETLKSHGVEIVKSETLRESIIDLYEVSYTEISEIIRTSEGTHFSIMLPVYSRLFEMTPADIEESVEDFRAKPIDYTALLQSDTFRGALSFWRELRIVAIQLRLNAIEKNRELIDAINLELEK